VKELNSKHIAFTAEKLVFGAEGLHFRLPFFEDPQLTAVHGDGECSTCSETARLGKSAAR
jgi:hypothetical protein